MKIEATPQEITELLQAIVTSKEQSSIEEIVNCLSNPRPIDVLEDRE